MVRERSDLTVRNRSALARTPEHDLALDCLLAGIEAAHPRTVIGSSIERDGPILSIDGTEYDRREYDRLFVIGGGNAAGRVAAALESVLGDAIDDGVVVTDDPVELSTIECVEGAHPVPNERAVKGTRELLSLAERAGDDDLVLGVVTGGGSALLPAPAGDVSLTDLQAVTEALLTSGAAIGEINAVRKHLSAIKGGQLARTAVPATLVGLVFSDVVGNDLSVVASGPLAPDETTFEDALDVLDRYDVDPSETVRRHLQEGSIGGCAETPTADSEVFEGVRTHVLADNFTALDAAREVARDHGYEPVVLSSRVRGEASEAAKTHVAVVEEVRATGHPVEPPAVLLSGGETTVTVTEGGDGGPNQEFALSAALELDDPDVALGSVDTDGIDGNVDAAGGLVDGRTIDDAADARKSLRRNDAHPALDRAGALVQTGQTGTNVNDLRVIVVPTP